MTKEHLQTFIAVTVKANGAGIIQISDWPPIFAALQAAEAELKAMEAATAKKTLPIEGAAAPTAAGPIANRFKRAKQGK